MAAHAFDFQPLLKICSKTRKRNSISPKQDPFLSNPCAKLNFPQDYKPNINDLRQLFDDHSRHHHDDKKGKTNRHSSVYSDAKFSGTDDVVCNPKASRQQMASMSSSASRNIDFERVKQKFDKPVSTGSSSRNKKARNFSSFLKFTNKRNETETYDVGSKKFTSESSKTHDDHCDILNAKKFTDTSLGENKKDSYMNNSINLDGLKVSEDDDDDVSSLKAITVFRFTFCRFYFAASNFSACFLH